MSDHSDSQRRGWNNDGMDPDWRPSFDRSPIPECKKCGRELFEAMVKAWPHTEFSIMNSRLPEFPECKRVNLDIDRLKEFNAQYREVAEFASWVCGVELKDLCRADMMKYLNEKAFVK